MRRHIGPYAFVALVTVVMLVVAACGGGEEPTAEPSRPTAAPATTAPQATAAAPATQAPAPTATSIPTPTPRPTPTPVVEKPIRGGILRERLNADIRANESWDSHRNGGIVQIRVVPNLFNGLLMTNELDSTKIQADLAASWEISADGLTYTYKLTPGIKYHDGQPFKASDAVWSYKRITGEISTGYVSHINNIIKPYMKSIEAPDDQTVIIKTNFPSLTFLYSTTNLFANVYPERLGNAYVADPNKKPIGTGAYFLEERKADISIKVRKNPSYFKKDANGEQLPYLDGVDFTIIPDSFTGFSALRTGKFDEADYLDPGLLNDNIVQFRKEFPDWVYGTGFGSWREYAFNNKAPFNDVRIRTALDLLVDRPAFVAARYSGYGHSGASPMIPPSLGGNYGLTDQETSTLINTGPVTPERVNQAKALFQQAGVKFDGFTFGILTLGNLPQYDDDALVLVDQWRKQGFKVTLDKPPGGSADFTRRRIAGDFEVYYVPASSFSDDPDFVLGLFYPTGAGQNYGKFSDAKLDQLYSDQQRQVDLAKRRQIAQELQRYILTTANWHPKVAWAGAWTAVSPRMKNYTALCPGAYCFRARFERVWLAPEAPK